MNVVVIGGGIIGLCAADELIRRGHRVTIIDRTGCLEGCSYGNGGIIVPSHFIPLASPGMVRIGLKMMLSKSSPFGLAGIPDLATLAWIGRFLASANKRKVEANSPLLAQLNLSSREIYEGLMDRLKVSAGYAQRGLLMLCNTDRGFAEEIETAETANRLGLKTKILSSEKLAEHEAEMEFQIKGAVHFLDDAHLTPPAFMHALRDHLESKGAVFVCSEAGALEVSQGKIVFVDTVAGNVEGEEFVLAAGAWSGELAATAGVHLPMLSGKGYGFTVANPPQTLNTPCILTEARVAVTPMLDGVRFVGTLELGHPVDDIRQSRVKGMQGSIERYFPAYEATILEAAPVWSGHRPCTPDGLPYIGRSRRVRNLTFATGHAMMGMSLGPISGRLVGTIVDGEPSELPIEALSPDRYE